MQNKVVFLVMLFAFVLLIALFSPSISLALRNQIIDIMMGAVIGIFCSQFIWRVRIDKEFQQGLIPVLQSSLQYSQTVTNYFIRRENDIDLLKEKIKKVEKSLQTQYGRYPEWVYEAGFNPGLRSGFRFYLISIERMIEILLSMDYLAHCGVSTDLIMKISDLISTAMQKNAELMNVLIGYFEDNQLRDISANFTSDISVLENATSRIVPSHLELLDISPDYVTLTAFIRDIKDLRKLLLQLVMALPANVKK